MASGQNFYKDSYLVPGPVEKLKVHVDKSIPSATLTWAPPQNVGAERLSDVSKYHIHFKPRGRKDYHEMTVDGSTTSIVLNRELSLTPHTSFTFEVRAQSGDNLGDWKSVSTVVGFVPGPVQNLECSQDAHKSLLTLQWEKPNNAKCYEDVTAYEIRFRPSNSWQIYQKTTVKAPMTSVLLTKKDGLDSLKTYDLEVRAKNADSEGEWSKVSEYTALIPEPVQNLKATVDRHKPAVTLKWDPPANAGNEGDVTNYVVWFREGENDPYKEKIVKGSTTTTVITRECGLRPLTTTTFEVRASSGDDVSPEWRTVSTFVDLVPGPVEKLKIHVDKTIPSATLTWTSPQNVCVGSLSEISQYHIRFKPKGRKDYHEMTVDGSTTSIVLNRESGLTPHTSFTFEVRAQSRDNLGDWKSVSTIVGFVPGCVQNLQCTRDADKSSLTLQWEKPNNAKGDKDVTAYEIRFRPSNSWQIYQKTTVKAPMTSVLLTKKDGLNSLKTYDLEVRAKNADDEGEWNKVSEYTALIPEPVQNLKATVDRHKPAVTLKWDPPANAGNEGDVTNYVVWFREGENDPCKEKIVKGSTTTTVITRECGLRPLTTTTFEVRASSGEDVSPEWRTVSTFVDLVPGPVEKLKIHVDKSIPSATLTWAPPQNVGADSPSTCSEVSQYHIRFKPKGRKDYREMTVDGSATSIVLNRESGLIPHTSFTFEVRTQSRDNLGDWKSVSTIVGFVPGRVQNLQCTRDADKSSLTLQWEKPNNVQCDEDVTAYDIRFRPSDSWRITPYDKTAVKAPMTSVVLTKKDGLDSLKTYDLEVRAKNADSEGEWSKVSEFTALIPDPVQNLKATVDSYKPAVTLKWDPPANAGNEGDVTNYVVWFREGENDPCKEKIVKGSTTTTVITRECGLRPLTTTTFEVRASSGDDVSPEGKTVSEFVDLVPGQVEKLKIHVDKSIPSATLTWAPPQNVDAERLSEISKYHIRFKPKGRKDYHEMTVDGSTTSVVLNRESGLTLHTSFTFEVRTQSGDNLGDWKSVSTVVVFVPGPVQNLQSTRDADKSSLTLQWEKPNNVKCEEDVTAYDIRFRPSDSWWVKSYEKTTVKAPTTSVLLTKKDGLDSLKTYDLEVRAKNADSKGEWSKVSENTGLVPGQVEKLKIHVDKSIPSATLTWAPPQNVGAERLSEISKYHIRFKPKGRKDYHEITVDGSTTSVVLNRESGLTLHTSFTFEVRAQSGDNLGDWKSVSTVVVFVPGPVQNLQSTRDADKSSLTLQWEKPNNVKCEEDVTAYDIRFRPSDSWWVKSYEKTTVKAPTTSVLLTKKDGLDSLKTYDLEVRAKNADSEGEWSKVSENTAGSIHLTSPTPPAAGTETGSKPTMLKLLKFICADSTHINITKEIGDKYKSFGTFLLKDSTGQKVNSIKSKHQSDPSQINTEILEEWLAGKGKQPVTWATLVEVLRDTELYSLADVISTVKCPNSEK